jgi:hypothetical protein
MSSPLLPYANALVRVQAKGAVTKVNGRLVEAAGSVYLYKCFLKRVQYTGVASGSVKQPLPSQLDGTMMPGASGDQFYYRGYYLQKATVAANFDWRGSLSSVTWTDVTTADATIRPGTVVEFALGVTPTMKAEVQRSTGVFGGTGIDDILYKEIGGVQLQLTGAEIQN